MLSKLRTRLTYANVMATIAVFIALGGSSYAAIRITSGNVPRDALTGADIKALTGKDVRNNSLTGADVRALTGRDVTNGGLVAEDFAAGELPQGPPGPPGSDAQFNGAAAGGDLAGSYPNPTLRDGAVTPGRISGIPAVRVEQARTAGQTIPNGGNGQNIAFGTEIFDTDGMFDPANNTRITFRTAGVYVVTGAGRWLENATGVRTIGLIPENDFLQFLAADTRNNNGAANPVRHSVSAVACFPANSFIVLRAIQTSGGNLDVHNADSPQVHLAATWLAPEPAGGCSSL